MDIKEFKKSLHELSVSELKDVISECEVAIKTQKVNIL